MAPTLEQIAADLLQLPEPSRARLAPSLLSRLGDPDETGTGLDWAQEAGGRYQDIQSGEVNSIPSEKVFHEA